MHNIIIWRNSFVKKRILLATNNAHKVEELCAMLGEGFEVLSASSFPEIEEPVEDADTFLGNAMKKALHYATHTGLPALADDSGLVVDALDGRPGVLSARYADSPQARIDRVLKEMQGQTVRSARFVCAMVLALPEKGASPYAAVGTVEGEIALGMSGHGGFGYDPIFYIPRFGKTLAELTRDEKNAISHRGKALASMRIVMQSAL